MQLNFLSLRLSGAASAKPVATRGTPAISQLGGQLSGMVVLGVSFGLSREARKKSKADAVRSGEDLGSVGVEALPFSSGKANTTVSVNGGIEMSPK